MKMTQNETWADTELDFSNMNKSTLPSGSQNIVQKTSIYLTDILRYKIKWDLSSIPFKLTPLPLCTS